jgi:hypothetical protein
MERNRPDQRGEHDRREQLAQTMRTLEEGITRVLEGEAFTQYLAAMSRFHSCSFGNVVLIVTQRPEATHVAGYRAWQALGRHVRKGEQGIRILAPHIRRVELADGEEERVVRAFGVGTAFDVAQTEGDPLPEPPIAQEFWTGSDTGRRLSDYTERYLQQHDIPVERVPEPLPGRPAAKGCWLPDERIIRVKDSLPPDQAAKTLVHETAHATADHHGWHARDDAETVTEGAAYVMLTHFGIDSAGYSFPYIAAWAEDREVLTRNLAGVQQTAHTIIRGIESLEPIDANDTVDIKQGSTHMRGGEAP